MTSGKTRLLFCIENACYGGGEKVFSLLIRSLPREKFEVYCASLPQGRFYEETKDSCVFLPLDLRSRFRFSNISRLKEYILGNGIDIVHSQGARADFFCALAAAGTGARAVATVPCPVEAFDVDPIRKAAYSLLASFAAKRMAGAITVTPGLAEKLSRRYPGVTIIPNPVDLAEFDPSRFDAGPLISEYGLRGKRVLAALGRLEWQKGYPCLLEALGLLLASRPDLRESLVCLIFGGGSLEASLKREAARLGLGGSVRFCGETGDAKTVLGCADIFLMPSLSEGQPLALLEAMAMAKPIVASDIPGIRDTVAGGSEAVLVPPEDPEALAAAVAYMMDNPDKAIAMGARARTRAEGYGLPVYISSHEDFYARLIGVKP